MSYRALFPLYVRISLFRALEAPRLAENLLTEPLQGEFEGGGGRGFCGKADPLSYLAQIHLRIRFAIVFGRDKPRSL